VSECVRARWSDREFPSGSQNEIDLLGSIEIGLETLKGRAGDELTVAVQVKPSPSSFDVEASSRTTVEMTLQAIKHQMKRLKSRDLRGLHADLIRVRHSTPEWRRATAKKIQAVQTGRFVTADTLERRIAGK